MNDDIRIDISDAELYARNPGWIFAEGEPRPAKLISLAIREIFAIGCKDASAIEIDEVYYISSTTDWLKTNRDEPIDPFATPYPISAVGVNGVASAFLIKVFSKRVTTYLNGRAQVVSGEQISLPKEIESSVRVVAFDFE